MITLDPTSWEWAKEQRNFSAWIRSMIEHEMNGEGIDAVIRQRNFWKAQYDAKEEEE